MSVKSHPTWVRGLKLLLGKPVVARDESHPTWVRGLKHISLLMVKGLCAWSHPTWVRGLKRPSYDGLAAGPCRTLHGCVD